VIAEPRELQRVAQQVVVDGDPVLFEQALDEVEAMKPAPPVMKTCLGAVKTSRHKGANIPLRALQRQTSRPPLPSLKWMTRRRKNDA
jgi:hypothetical protein